MQYQIEKISGEAPREWPNPRGGTVYYYKIKLVGVVKPVSIGKQKLNSLTIGQTIDGTIEPSDLSEDKFKAAPMGQPSAGQQSFNKSHESQDTQESIARSVALKAAVDFVSGDTKVTSDYVLAVADDFLAWLQGKASIPANTEPVVVPFDDGFGPAPTDDGFNGQEINLADIPF